MTLARTSLLSLAITAALLAVTTGYVRASDVFSDDFQDEALAANPAINTSSVGAGDAADIGISWTDENNNVDVVANPNGVGNTSSQVLQGNFAGSSANGDMNGNLLNSIFYSGATISVDFYLPGTGGANHDANVRLMGVNRVGNLGGLGGLDFEVDGDVGGAGGAFLGVDPGTIDLNHFGTGVWQNATWIYSDLDAAASTFDIALEITNLETGATVNGTSFLTFNPDSWTGLEEFTVVNPRFRGNAAFEAMLDNLSVDGIQWVPEPSTLSLVGLTLLGLLGVRRYSGS